MLKLVVALTVGLLLGSPDTARSVVLSAPAMYADALAKEKAVRQAMGSGQPSAAMIKAVRTVVSAYESLVRLYPASGYCDDALWNAAQLSIDASRRFGDAAQADSAAGLLKRLTAEYPTSKYARQAPDVLAVLAPSLPRPAPGSAAATPAAAPTPAPAAIADQPAAPAPLVVLRRIQRVALPDVVRLTLDLDAEVPFRQEELSGPSRLFFDFPGTTAASDLADRTIRFDGDADIVRQVRVGRQPGDTVRVVLETAGAASCSTSPLYTPYRLVIDCVRQSASRSAPEPGVSRPTPSTPATFARRAPACRAPAPFRADRGARHGAVDGSAGCPLRADGRGVYARASRRPAGRRLLRPRRAGGAGSGPATHGFKHPSGSRPVNDAGASLAGQESQRGALHGPSTRSRRVADRDRSGSRRTRSGRERRRGHRSGARARHRAAAGETAPAAAGHGSDPDAPHR